MSSRHRASARLFVLLAACAVAISALAAEPRVHFIVPAGAGGGLDTTARAAGRTLAAAGIVEHPSFENLSGGSGGRAIAHLIETAPRQHRTLMVSSTPLLIRSLQGIFAFGFRDLTPIASLIGDYGVFAVRADSGIADWQSVVDQLRRDPRSLIIAGGSARGSLDHLVAAMAVKSAGIDARRLRYLPYDAGAKALAGLLSGEAQLLSTGLGESLDMHRAGGIRILAVTSDVRQANLPGVPTLRELGYDVVFANWRGVFAAPGLDAAHHAALSRIIAAMVRHPLWQKELQRNAWVPVYHADADFETFLTAQEAMLRSLMTELGFLR